MAECSLARCQQERRAIRKELQRWTKNMVYILGLERVAEELMGRRKWKLYQDALIPKRSEPEPSSEDESMPSDPPPSLKIKTIEQINAPEDGEDREDRIDLEDRVDRIDPVDRIDRVDEKPRRPETILESLIKRPATHPKLAEEPVDWKPADKCYFCVDGERGEPANSEPHPPSAASPASESDSSSVSGARSPAGAPPLLQHLLQLQAHNPQTIAQFQQQMIAVLATLGSSLVPPLAQPWMLPRMPSRQPLDRLQEAGDKVATPSSPNLAEQPLDLSAKSTSSTSGTPPPDAKLLDNRLKRATLECSGNSSSRRTYSEEDLQCALRDIQSGRLGTRRAAVVYGIPRSTLRNKLNKHAPEPLDSDPDSEAERADSPHSVILKIPTFPPPDDKSSSPAAPPSAPIAPITPLTPIIPPQPQLSAPQQLMLPPSLFADAPSPSPQHLFLSDVIAKSITQKFQQPLERAPADLSWRAPERHVSVIKTPPEGPRPSYPAPSNSRGAPNNGQPATGKGTRPKRGKYRNYDRDSLVEAVKAVQRGEMSVHRAGSYYGVPHSTLEYKVKERHLMRPRKREPKPQPDVKPPPPKPPQPKPPQKPFTNGLNGPEGYPPAGYPFWGSVYGAPAPDLYTSHMMRRLREEAPPANGSFLEGIIRSSLERPGAALQQRLSAGADEPPARRARVEADHALAAEMRDAVQRLRADRLRPRASPPPAPLPAPPPAPPDRA